MIQKKILNKDEVNYILSLIRDEKWVHSDDDIMEYSPTWQGKKITKRHKKSGVNCWEIKICNLHTSFKKIENLLIDKLKKFNINSINCVNFIKYPKGGFLKRHKDTGGGYGSDSKLSLSIQISDFNDYDGGDLIVENEIASKELGTLIMFDSLRYHEVTEVKNGERISLVIFLNENNISNDSKFLF